MRTTLVAVYQNLEAAELAARAVRERGLAEEVAILPRRSDGPEQGQAPVITGPGYGVGQAGQREPGEGEPLGAGAAVGATIGGTVGLLASTYVIPGLAPLSSAGPVVSTLVGAGLGSLVGGLIEYGAAEHPGGLANNERDADNYPGTVRLGGALVVAVCRPRQVPECRTALAARGALELREHPGGPVGPAENRKPGLTHAGGAAPLPPGTAPWPGAGVHGHQALNAGAARETGRPGPLAGPGARPGSPAPDAPTRPGEGQPGPGGGVGMGD